MAAIRKWRRAVPPIVASRVRTNGSRELVEVRLEDVQARVAETMANRPAPAPAAGAEPVGALIPLSELSGLFDRLADAERRAAKAETEAAFLRDQLAARKVEPVPAAPRRRWWQR